LHGRSVKLSIGLSARTADRRSLSPVEHSKLNAGGICDSAHKPIQRIDLSNQMALAQAPDGRIARHLADRLEPMGYEKGCGAEARSSGCSFAAGVPSAYNNHIEAFDHLQSNMPSRSLPQAKAFVSRETFSWDPKSRS
jgi:hypothetical protein